MAAAAPTIQAIDAIDRVWSGHSVNFAVLATKRQLVVGYYDANRQLTLAARPIKGGPWHYQKLDSWTNWDSHNAIALAEDGAGRIHVAANMHVDPLIYYCTDTDGDVRTAHRVERLVDAGAEDHMTYPVFLKDPAGRLILKYRDGGSGNGNEIYDVYDDKAGAWSRLTAAPFLDGEGLRNAYFVGPTLGPDKQFHLVWVWRDTPDAATNHDLSYARSPDLVHWFTSDGKPLPLPITFKSAEIVDPVPVKGGMINNNTLIGFDDQGRPVITYHKYDKAGHTQIWLARREAAGWKLAQVSRWDDFRWDFGGGGSLDFQVRVSGAAPIGNGLLKVPVVRQGRSLELVVRSSDLSLVEERPGDTLKDQLAKVAAVPDGMQFNMVTASGADGTVYALGWAARPPHRDLPSPDIPEPTTLVLYTLKRP